MFVLSLIVAVLYSALSVWISMPWICDLALVIGSPLAWLFVTCMAIVPGFLFSFYLMSLLTLRVKKLPQIPVKFPEMTVLIPAYNAEKTIKKCLNSVLCQRYPAPVRIIVVDDGSTDRTAEIVGAFVEKTCRIELIAIPHAGKAAALNTGLACIETMYFATLDSDTFLDENALNNIVNHILQTGKVAVAGLLVPENRTESLICRMQMWDYSLGIFGIKLMQNAYGSTLVTQGAFSAYITRVVRKAGGWQCTVGEDIVLTFALLKKGFCTGFEHTAIAFTQVPCFKRDLLRQRRRWARGMVEAFKRNRSITVSDIIRFPSKMLILFDLLFPLADFAIAVVYPLGILFAIFGCHLLVGPITLLLIPLSLFYCFVVNGKLKKACRQAHFDLPRRNFIAFIMYILVYQLLLSPSCMLGYLEEAFYREKEW